MISGENIKIVEIAKILHKCHPRSAELAIATGETLKSNYDAIAARTLALTAFLALIEIATFASKSASNSFFSRSSFCFASSELLWRKRSVKTRRIVFSLRRCSMPKKSSGAITLCRIRRWYILLASCNGHLSRSSLKCCASEEARSRKSLISPLE